MKKVVDTILQKLSRQCPQTSFDAGFWDGTEKHYGAGFGKFKIVFRSEAVIKKILNGGPLAFGEGYMAGDIDVAGDLQALAGMYDRWRELIEGASLKTKARILWHRAFARGTIAGAKKNIARHYDIGNDFYSQWLDPSMTYSCAYFKSEADDLETAQINKYEHICRKLGIKEGESLVDIGCGWGQMMFFAAKKYGAECTGYTLSKNQYEYILKKAKDEGLEEKIKVRFQDYRKAQGSFDKFISIGMFEHVGKRYQKKFFDIAKKILKPGGIGLLHTIGKKDEKSTDPWILRYIFPGGYIPSLAQIVSGMAKTDLIYYDIEDLRRHYGKTLDAWIVNFENNLDQIKKIITAQTRDEKKTEVFCRMWRLYLNASAASFKNGGNRLYQVLFSNEINNELPLTRDYIYSD